MTVQQISTSNDLQSVRTAAEEARSIVEVASKRIVELENNYLTFREVRNQYNRLKRNFRKLLSDRSKFYSDECTGLCVMISNEDGTKQYFNNFRVYTVIEQIGVYGPHMDELAGTPVYSYDFDPKDMTLTKEILAQVLPEGWTMEEKVYKHKVWNDELKKRVEGDYPYIDVISPKFIK